MYANHKTCDHDEWRSNTDECHTSRNKGKKSDETPAKSTNYLTQKLTLNDKLCSALCTQAGISAEAVNRICEDAQQGNE